MKIYVVAGKWDYEGYSAPYFASVDKQKAEFAKDHPPYSRYDGVDIFELEIDEIQK